MGRSVLVVDDERDIRMLARFILEPRGFKVLEAGTGPEAFALLEDTVPDVILLDIRLAGGIDGLDVLDRMRGDERLCEIPIVVMSAHSSGDSLERARRSGSSGYLVKPFREAELLKWVSPP